MDTTTTTTTTEPKRHCAEAAEIPSWFVPLLLPEEIEELDEYVTAARDDAMTLHFTHRVKQPPKVLEELVKTRWKSWARDVYKLDDKGDIYFHASFAAVMLLEFIQVSAHGSAEILLLRRFVMLVEMPQKIDVVIGGIRSSTASVLGLAAGRHLMRIMPYMTHPNQVELFEAWARVVPVLYKLNKTNARSW